MMAASVVDLPDPVGPVTRISPLGLAANSETTGGSPSSSNVRILKGMVRNAPATAPRCMKMFARKRDSPFTPNDRSSSLCFSKCARCSSVSTEKHSCLVSTGPSGESLSGTIDPSIRSSGGEPVVMCMSLAPFSIIVFRSWWRLTFTSAGCVMGLLSPRCLVGHRDAHALFGRGHAVDDLPDAAGAQGAHPVLDGPQLQLGGRRALKDHLLQAVGEAHDLVERDAAFIAAAVAGAAAGALHELGVGDLLGGEAAVLQDLRLVADGLLAVDAALSREALGEHQAEGRCD